MTPDSYLPYPIGRPQLRRVCQARATMPRRPKKAINAVHMCFGNGTDSMDLRLKGLYCCPKCQASFTDPSILIYRWANVRIEVASKRILLLHYVNHTLRIFALSMVEISLQIPVMCIVSSSLPPCQALIFDE
ncbi:hypothetical protein QAD02_022358 [Eretmocerus hayati]|uniref:Uncharacterized protein n=1 Tax=Eretmocerus hayati TaxID=131215 RepID=A0ACC2PTC3_9HYME|nr:hypothetical protein QAD02_022358 [Eretmocerus hayati]